MQLLRETKAKGISDNHHSVTSIVTSLWGHFKAEKLAKLHALCDRILDHSTDQIMECFHLLQADLKHTAYTVQTKSTDK
jgi:hypothetical protein